MIILNLILSKNFGITEYNFLFYHNFMLANGHKIINIINFNNDLEENLRKQFKFYNNNNIIIHKLGNLGKYDFISNYVLKKYIKYYNIDYIFTYGASENKMIPHKIRNLHPVIYIANEDNIYQNKAQNFITVIPTESYKYIFLENFQKPYSIFANKCIFKNLAPLNIKNTKYKIVKNNNQKNNNLSLKITIFNIEENIKNLDKIFATIKSLSQNFSNNHSHFRIFLKISSKNINIFNKIRQKYHLTSLVSFLFITYSDTKIFQKSNIIIFLPSKALNINKILEAMLYEANVIHYKNLITLENFMNRENIIIYNKDILQRYSANIIAKLLFKIILNSNNLNYIRENGYKLLNENNQYIENIKFLQKLFQKLA